MINLQKLHDDYHNAKISINKYSNILIFNILSIMNSNSIRKENITFKILDNEIIVNLVIKKGGALVIEIGKESGNISYSIPEIIITSSKEIIILNDDEKYIYKILNILEKVNYHLDYSYNKE